MGLANTKTKNVRTGRSPRQKSPVKASRFEARLTHRQKNLFERAAILQGRSMTDFVIQSAEAAAQQEVHEDALIRLTAKDTEVLVKALLDPPSPNQALRKALSLHKKMIASR